MTHSVVAAIEARDQRIAQLERRLEERESTVSLMADELAFMATTVVRLREDARPPRCGDCLRTANDIRREHLRVEWERPHR